MAGNGTGGPWGNGGGNRGPGNNGGGDRPPSNGGQGPDSVSYTHLTLPTKA